MEYYRFDALSVRTVDSKAWIPSMGKVFISYSHNDEKWKDRVLKHLGVLVKENRLTVWDDRQIAAGQDWFPEIKRALEECDVALLLVSVDFLNSGFILNQEVPKLLSRRLREGTRVVPVILRDCLWSEVSWLKDIQVRPKDGKPLASFSKSKVEAVLTELAKEVMRLLLKPFFTKQDDEKVISLIRQT